MSAIGFGTVILPMLVLRANNGNATFLTAAVGTLVALAGATLFYWFAPRATLSVLGIVIFIISCWLLVQITYPPSNWFVSFSLGAGFGLAAPQYPRRGIGRSLALIGAGVLLLAGTNVFAGVRLALAVGAGIVLVCSVVSVSRLDRKRVALRRASVLAVVSILFTSLTTAWVGASTPSTTWFGPVINHGPRQGNRVAITFDDGPNSTYTLKVQQILDQYGVKATFFTVGKALKVRPDISQALLADGQLLGDHSYHHDSTSWLNPWYHEISLTQSVFQQDLGVCPAFFRPPHGERTPFMGHIASERGMTMVTWDVSAGDWATTDGTLVAQRILDQVKPGSIILLHDGIDGNLVANRAVLLTALPLILDGLKARGLQPVRLDELLGKPGYVPCGSRP